MADWHLAELDHALMQTGWKIVSQMPGDERKIAATWAIQSSTQQQPLLIDFDGLAESDCLPLSLAYACTIRDVANCSLYFGRKGKHWSFQLGEFVTAINRLENEQEQNK
jgi:hypothetical protein